MGTFHKDFQRTVESALAKAVASAAAANLQTADGVIRHIALFLLPDDDLQAIYRVRELIQENCLLRAELRLQRVRTAALKAQDPAAAEPAPAEATNLSPVDTTYADRLLPAYAWKASMSASATGARRP